MTGSNRRNARAGVVAVAGLRARRATIIAALVTVAALGSSPALAQSAEPAPAAPAVPPAPSTQGYGDHDKTCAAWTDDCVSCVIDSDGKLNCNNIGIACQPRSVTCIERRAEPHK
jgi:hypothetical protein